MEDINIFLEKYLGGKRLGTLNNDEAAMLTALSWASKSKDPSTQVGACIVNDDGRVLSTGYNGTPNNWCDEEFPWEDNKDGKGEINSKYPYVVHAEMNSFVNYCGSIKDFNNATMYVTLFPCSNCAKLIAQAGIKRVVYLMDDRKGTMDNICAKTLLEKCSVEYISFQELQNVSQVDFSFNSEKEKIIYIHPNKKNT